MRDIEAQRAKPLPEIEPLRTGYQGPKTTPYQPPVKDVPSTDVLEKPDIGGKTPSSGAGGGDGNGTALSYANMLANPQPQALAAAPAPVSSIPETIDLTTGQPQSGKTGFGPLDKAMANPGTTAVNLAAGFIPGIGPLNTISGLLGGPTIGSMGKRNLSISWNGFMYD
jgi:hypothetical protein